MGMPFTEDESMELAMVGLGRMGMNMARRLLKGGHRVVAYNRTPEKTEKLAEEGAVASQSLEEAVEKLSPPRILWIMLPAGAVVDEHIQRLAPLLSRGDILVEGGNSYYKDDLQREKILAEKGVRFMDAGVSGGIWGFEAGFCLMLGGARETFQHLEPLFQALAPKDGYLYCGPAGAGHFVKMIHNGIEYGMMQAYGEGFQILKDSSYGGSLDLAGVAHLWNQGSVVRSWLLELAEIAFSKNGDLSDIGARVEDSGEGRWAVQQALETGVSAPVIALSLMRRFRSRDPECFSDRVVAALRREFGGHDAAPAG
jgi:6-phosphogluconate dehydrogenase